MVLRFHIEESTSGIGGLRSLSSQILASLSSNLALLDLVMAVNFATIALPDLLNSSKSLSLNEEQASWFGSTAFLAQPIGALVSGPMVDYFGRKKSNLLANIPHLLAWILMYFAWDLPSLFVANALLGFGTGILEAPIVSYLGEICHPSTRGSLSVLNQAFGGAGMLIMYYLGTVVTWRIAALVSCFVPLAAMIVALLAPNTPVWLLSQGRPQEAMKALRYLRGWTTEEVVKQEFDELVLYTDMLQQCVLCSKIDHQISPKDCEHFHMNCWKRSMLKFKCVMLSKETMRPFCFILIYFVFYNMSGQMAARPNLVNVCGAFGMPGDAKHIVFMVGVLIFLATVVQAVIIRPLGKRKLVIISMLGTTVCAIGLSVYAKLKLSDTVFSYNPATFPKETSYVPLVLLYVMTFLYGIMLPWVLLGEVFPFRSRASAQGIAAAGNYLITFIATKTFIDLEFNIHLWGAYALYAVFGVVGTVYLYLFTPETEGKSLQEIENYYNSPIHLLADDPLIKWFRKLKS